ncbi:kinesin-like protein Klp61F [Amyelois transitella]|uniref:kinesin-like protein Klp61F n=1 Tax=Amyelois transitella TaxID=680683 RepID=UPI00298FFC35|nr:kinesin-like protein Klp61F [Amyelois transitella]
MTSEKGNRKDKNQNIQVFVRLRPLNQRERDIKSLGVVEVANNREVVVRQSQQTSLTKKFTFDRAFSPHTKQVEVYQEVVAPLIEEVLAGYNCTVFAYGQTGTGKTHTMVGENTGDETTWQNDPLAGIIPRALSQLFDELRISNTEYTVRVSYLELYNEELFDLLSTSEDNSKLRIYEDVTRKGSNIVNGLEEITVYNKNEVYKIMAQGQERKRVASTLMNAQSSRSHTVFTIVVHMKENSPEGEELVKIGKLNLVDLAGSENISKAGSDNPAKRERARECVNINQSLLTLGRVITALVERHPHIPYRESKLTRILQESLGGKTKTSIIATISPGHKDLEETMSTLEYAHRAKNIQNRPEVNQKMTKKAILKEYAEEIDRLKRDLQAARDKTGVYLANETYTEMTLKQEEQKKEIQELLLKKKAMEDERDRMLAVFEELNKRIAERESELSDAMNKLDDTQAKLVSTSNILHTTKQQCEEQQHLVSKLAETELQLGRQARELAAAAHTAVHHVHGLHGAVHRRQSVESRNLELTREFRAQSCQQRAAMLSRVDHIHSTLMRTLNGLLEACDTYTTDTVGIQEENKLKMEELVRKICDTMAEIKTSISTAHSNLLSSRDTHIDQITKTLTSHSVALEASLNGLLGKVGDCVRAAAAVNVAGDVDTFVKQWYSGASGRVQSLAAAHAAFAEDSGARAARRRAAARRSRDGRRARAQQRAATATAAVAEIEEEKTQIEKRLRNQLSAIEAERRDMEKRLDDRMLEENQRLEQLRRIWEEDREECEALRRMLSQREARLEAQRREMTKRQEELMRETADEKQALEERLSKKIQQIEEQRKLLEDRMEKLVSYQNEQLRADEEDVEDAEANLEEHNVDSDAWIQCLDKYAKAFDEGTTSINTDMEAFCANVVEVVEHVFSQFVAALAHAQQQIETDTHSTLESEKASCTALCSQSSRLLSSVADDTQTLVQTLYHNIEENNNATIQQLGRLSSSAGETAAAVREHTAGQKTVLHQTREYLDSLHGTLKEALDKHEELEETYLAKEYRVYTPTGGTPQRTEYRLPRQLAATSPHDRILARFRAARERHGDQDCIVIESANNTMSSSAESSVSEESGELFAAPSPPDSGLPRAANIVKSTSETDIYSIRRHQDQNGKENTNRSVSYKKPSKLPAPSSHKKPLVERNAV